MSLSQEERLRLIQLELELDEETEGTAGGAFGQGAAMQFGENLLGVPQFIGRMPSYIAAGVQGLVGSHGDPGVLFGGDFDFSRRLEKQDRPFLAEMAFNIPRPEVSDVAGVVEAIKQNPATGADFGDRFDEEKLAFEQEQMALQEQFPKSYGAGEVAGDIFTLAGGRNVTGAGKKMRDFERAIAERLGQGPRTIAFSEAAIKATDKGTKAVLKDIASSPAVSALARGAGRSLETGLEAASLDILHGDDPMETAAYAAAGQAVGSTFLTGLQHSVKGGLGSAALNIGAASFAAGSLWQIVKDMTPGGRDSFIDSLEAGYEKVMIALLLGTIAGVTGGGRIRGDSVFADQMPKWADAISAIPRAGVISVLEDLVNSQPEEQRNIETALNRMATAPGELAKDISDKLDKALEQGTFAETIDELKETNQEFRDWLDEE